MRFFLSFLVLILISFSYLNANEYKETKIFKLKKDENKKILVKYDRIQKLFKFRWTLYVNDGLVVFRSYSRVVAQNILYLRHKNQSFRVELTPKGTSYYNVPYLLIKFKEYDYKTNEATFEMFLSDKKDRVKLEYLKNS
jgi:hypothetical protein